MSSFTAAVDTNMYTAIHAVMNYLNVALLSLLQLKHQHKEISPFDEHNTIMLLYIMTCLVYSIALIALLLRAHQPSENACLATLEHISLLSGALACDLLLLILFPLFGYFLLAFGGVLALLRSYQKIMGRSVLEDVAAISKSARDRIPNVNQALRPLNHALRRSYQLIMGQGSGGGVPSNHNSIDQGSGGGVPSNHNSTDQGSGDHNTAPIPNV